MKVETQSYLNMDQQPITRHVITLYEDDDRFDKVTAALSTRELWQLCLLCMVEIGKAINQGGAA